MLGAIHHAAAMTFSSKSTCASVRRQWSLQVGSPQRRFVSLVVLVLLLLQLLINWDHNDGDNDNNTFMTTDAFVMTPSSYSRMTSTGSTNRGGITGAFPLTRHCPRTGGGLVPTPTLQPPRQHHHYTTHPPTTGSIMTLLHSTKIQSNAMEEEDGSNNTPTPFTVLMRQISKTLSRTSWISWWSQVILTVISSIILLFAKSISGGSTSSSGRGSFVSSGIGILLSTISILWTWGNGTRLSQRLLRVATVDPTTTIPMVPTLSSKTTATTTTFTISNMIQRAITIGVVINCIGLLCNLLAAQQIIGVFAIKVFTSSTTTSRAALLGTAASSLFSDTLQPLDVLIIQANTNVLLSQYISLVALLSLIPNILQKIHRHQKQNHDEEDRTVTQTTTSSTTTTIVNDE